MSFERMPYYCLCSCAFRYTRGPSQSHYPVSDSYIKGWGTQDFICLVSRRLCHFTLFFTKKFRYNFPMILVDFCFFRIRYTELKNSQSQWFAIQSQGGGGGSKRRRRELDGLADFLPLEAEIATNIDMKAEELEEVWKLEDKLKMIHVTPRQGPQISPVFANFSLKKKGKYGLINLVQAMLCQILKMISKICKGNIY